MRYFVNKRTRMCRMLHGPAASLETLAAEAFADGFEEVTEAELAEFRAETAVALELGWKPGGRVSYARFMERLQAVPGVFPTL